MTDKEHIKLSKFLSLVLRHKPETIDLDLDQNGWTDTKDLLDKVNKTGNKITFEELQYVVENNDKKRFSFSNDFSKIRANQGHSIKLDLQLVEKKPPDILFHGTTEKNLNSIRTKGLLKGQRHHVHLSTDKITAHKVGQRYGKPIVLTINTGLMQKQGIRFYQSENGVWLTDFVDPKYIT